MALSMEMKNAVKTQIKRDETRRGDQPETPEQPARPGHGDVSILIVDDTPENLVALEAVLSELGQRLVKVTSGQEALRMLLKEEFAVILLDVNMPGMNGFETAALIRQRKHT